MNLEYPLDPKFHAYKDIEIIKCKQAKIIVIGWNANEQEYGAIVFHKIKSCDQSMKLSELFMQIEQQKSYDQIRKQIQRVTGPFHSKESIYGFGIIGFHKFLQGYYITYISQVDTIAKIGRHKIYTIKNTLTLPLFEYQTDRKTRKNEEKYLQTLGQFKLQNFYFSPTYDLSNSLAINMIRNSKKIFQFRSQQEFKISQDNSSQGVLESSDIFNFNHELIKQFHDAMKNKKFIFPIIHGYCKHINVNLRSTIFNIIVIARRSRHHAGTRYIKRGISPNGFVANFVEIQQIVINYSSSQDTRPVCSSFIQVRGSVPTYWMQRPSIHIPKPAIQLKPDDYMYLATRKHFYDLHRRYGSLVYAVNLMKMKEKVPRESLLSQEYRNSVNFINKQDLSELNQIHYVQIDMKYNLRLDKKLFVNKMKTIAYFAIQNTGIFLCVNPSSSNHEQFVQFQNGVVRANCVDCLDRTNSFQQLVGQTALAIQLNRLIRQNVTFDSLELSDLILNQYSKLYEEMGDLISIQYGSSLAHKQKIQKSTQSRFQFLIAITRHVNNNWNDYDRQRQMDVFLGFKPDPNGPQIWDEKPSIFHYPSKDLQRFEKGDWFEQAQRQFLKKHYIKDFKLINSKQDYERNLPHMERLMKQDLANKFNADIVNSLANQRQSISLLQFFVMPKSNYNKIFWPLQSLKVRKTQTLKQQLQFCYNRLDFIKSQQQTRPVINSQKQIKQDSINQTDKNFTSNKKVKPSQSFHFEDKGSNIMMRNADKFIENELFDENQKKIVQKYMLGEFIEDNQIEEQIQNYVQFLCSEINNDWPMQQQIQKQLRQLVLNMNNKNFINFSEFNTDLAQNSRKKKKTFIENPSSLKTFKTIEDKNQKIKQNKILILEQIMKKNFSHGNIQKIQEI